AMLKVNDFGPKNICTKYPIKIITSFSNRERLKMLMKCVECDHVLVGDEVEYLYKGKSYCDDCYKAIKKAGTGDR
ncbi:MAG TPA: hypothetical protein VFY68_18070, partial [Nitrososphaeraceae archaeon]|nr:hypothetical protein [Nitrososphaeraceae archaeon]